MFSLSIAIIVSNRLHVLAQYAQEKEFFRQTALISKKEKEKFFFLSLEKKNFNVAKWFPLISIFSFFGE